MYFRLGSFEFDLLDLSNDLLASSNLFDYDLFKLEDSTRECLKIILGSSIFMVLFFSLSSTVSVLISFLDFSLSTGFPRVKYGFL